MAYTGVSLRSASRTYEILAVVSKGSFRGPHSSKMQTPQPHLQAHSLQVRLCGHVDYIEDCEQTEKGALYLKCLKGNTLISLYFPILSQCNAASIVFVQNTL